MHYPGLKTHQVFDIKKLSQFLRVSEIWEGFHGLVWHNLRFYYNPITGLLEPVGFDAHASIATYPGYITKRIENNDAFFTTLFNDPVFAKKFNDDVSKFTSPQLIPQLYENIRQTDRIDLSRSPIYSIAKKLNIKPIYAHSTLQFNQTLFKKTYTHNIPSPPSVPTNPFKPYDFFVAGHVYGAVNPDILTIHPPFIPHLHQLNTDRDIKFGIFAGDIVEKGTQEEWDLIDKLLSDIQKPIHMLPGNHDLATPIYSQRYPSTFSSQRIQSDLYLFLDSISTDPNVYNNQLKFIKNQLSTTPNRLFISMHSLLWSKLPQFYPFLRPSYNGYDSDLLSDLLPILNNLNIPVYIFAGDLGIAERSPYFYSKIKNVHYIATGMGGGG